MRRMGAIGKERERTPWWASIVARITLVVALLVAAAAIVSGWLVYRSGSDQLVKEARADMEHTLDLATGRIDGFASMLAGDIDFLATAQPVVAYLAAVDSGDTALIRREGERAALLLGSFIRSRDQYAQVRVIAADSLGHELIRFDRSGTSVSRVPDSLLQAKGDRDYFLATMALPEGERFFSAIDLNKEHGRVQVPWLPTLRAAAPLYVNDRAAGMVIINTDMRPLFEELLALSDNGRVLLADGDGELLLDRDTALVFRREFGGSSTLDALYAGLRVDRPIERERIAPWIGARRAFEPPRVRRRFEVAVVRGTAALLSGMQARRDRDLLRAAAVGLAFVLLTAVFAGGIARGLSRLTDRVGRYAQGEGGIDLPLDRRDEIGRLSRSLEHMRQRIDERFAGSEEARHRAEESDRARREFLANMSHEVRTPLNAIIAMSEGIDARALGDGDRERLALVRRSAQRLKLLVDDLLLHARLVEGRLELRLADTDVGQLLGDVARAHHAAAEAKSIALRLAIAGVPPVVHVDGLRLHQVVDNLVGNAVRFTDKGHVDVSARMEGTVLVLEVNDTGPGLSAEERERVFERFERASAAERSDGAGLGLAITRRLVELMGGTIGLESAKGLGSRFTVALPLSTTGQPAAGVAPEVPPVKGLRVLHVEDVASNRMVLAQWAEKWEWQLLEAATPEEAIKHGEHGDFDLLLIDLDLGEGMRGSQLAMRLRGLKRLRYVPMIAITAYVGEGEEEEILKAGMNDRVTKPVDRRALLASVAFWCAPLAHPRVDTRTLEEQYDHDREKLLTVMQQYRREATAARIGLRKAMTAGDGAAIADLHHKLVPAATLLGIADALVGIAGARSVLPDAAALEEAMDALRELDRCLLGRQRALQAATGGPVA